MVIDMKENAPKIRFKEFTDNWEQHKLLDTIESIIDYRGRTPRKLGYDWSGDGILALSALNVKMGFIDTSIEAHYGDSYLYSLWMKDTPLHKGQVLLTTEAPAGNVAQIPDNKRYILSQRTIAFKVKKNIICDNYLAKVLMSQNIQIQISNLSTGGTAKGISQRTLSELNILLPKTLKEQNKISEFISNLDNLINLHQNKYDTLLKVKKLMVEKMFPKNNNLNPEIRFKKFTEVWEQCKLKELANIYDGTHQTPNYKDSGIKFLSVENIKTLDSDKYISYEDFKKNFKIYPEKNDILMTRIGDIGTTNIVKDNALKAYYVSLALLKCKNINPNYLNIAICSQFVVNGLKQRALLTAIPMKINKDQIGEVDILYPLESSEQIKIGQLFNNLDNLIALHQCKCNKLIEIKKTMLQKMFI